MTRLVIVGNGMVGSRFADDLLRADTARRFRIEILGAEDCAPYNRVLLSEVVAGTRDVHSLTLPQAPDERLRVHSGRRATAIDRADRAVHDSWGERIRYDFLVLATGSTARIPPIPGLTSGKPGRLPGGVLAMRTIDDARAIAAASVNARRAVVLGAGVLGLEVACGLARRGVATTVVHPMAGPMERQLDDAAGAVVAGSLRDLKIAHRLGIGADRVDVVDDRIRGVHLADGSTLECDLLILTTGTLPDVALAKTAGLAVDRGIVVDDELATADRRIFAIGDCAQPSEGGSGLVAQGWSQSRRLATILSGGTSAGRPVVSSNDDVVRLKAPGLDVVTMGVSGPGRSEDPKRRTVRLSDPDAGRHVEIVVSEGRLTGATCIGAGELAASLLTAYNKGTPVPRDPMHLLLGGAFGGPAAAAADGPDRIVCRCNNVTAGEIHRCHADGATSVADVAKTTRATTGCGSCRDDVCTLLASLTGKSSALAALAPPAGSAEPSSLRSPGESSALAALAPPACSAEPSSLRSTVPPEMAPKHDTRVTETTSS